MWWEQPTSMWFAQQCFSNCSQLVQFGFKENTLSIATCSSFFAPMNTIFFHIPIYVDMTFWIGFPNDDFKSWMWQCGFNFPFPFCFFLLFDYVGSTLEQYQLICWCTRCNFKLIWDSCKLTNFYDSWLSCRFLQNVRELKWFFCLMPPDGITCGILTCMGIIIDFIFQSGHHYCVCCAFVSTFYYEWYYVLMLW